MFASSNRQKCKQKSEKEPHRFSQTNSGSFVESRNTPLLHFHHHVAHAQRQRRLVDPKRTLDLTSVSLEHARIQNTRRSVGIARKISQIGFNQTFHFGVRGGNHATSEMRTEQCALGRFQILSSQSHLVSHFPITFRRNKRKKRRQQRRSEFANRTSFGESRAFENSRISLKSYFTRCRRTPMKCESNANKQIRSVACDRVTSSPCIRGGKIGEIQRTIETTRRGSK